jgi:hypothetical protein
MKLYKSHHRPKAGVSIMPPLGRLFAVLVSASMNYAGISIVSVTCISMGLYPMVPVNPTYSNRP